MNTLRAVGRGAASKKYDIISAMIVYGMHQDKTTFKLCTRLIALITTRYNWQRNELSIGQKEIARLWAVEPRTVKREFAKLKDRNWISIKRAGARGRVSTYGINIDVIMSDTREVWDAVGPDFVLRADEMTPATLDSKIVHLNFEQDHTVQPTGTWDKILRELQNQNAALYENWYRKLQFQGVENDIVQLRTKSSFVARYIESHLTGELMRIIRAEIPNARKLVFVVG